MIGGIVVGVPGSKSIANRALVVASLADGESALTNVPDGDDTALVQDHNHGHAHSAAEKQPVALKPEAADRKKRRDS